MNAYKKLVDEIFEYVSNRLEQHPAGEDCIVISKMIKDYRKDVSLTKQNKLAEMKQQRKKCGLHTPYGWKSNPHKSLDLIVHEREQGTLKVIRYYREEGYSYDEIAKVLNRWGCKTRKSKPFKANQVHAMYKNMDNKNFLPPYCKEDAKNVIAQRDRDKERKDLESARNYIQRIADRYSD